MMGRCSEVVCILKVMRLWWSDWATVLKHLAVICLQNSMLAMISLKWCSASYPIGHRISTALVSRVVGDRVYI